MNTTASADKTANLSGVLEQYLADLQAGRKPDRARFLAEHPDLAAQLQACLSGLEFIYQAAQPRGEQPLQLGDFRIVREIGRGGMGVVYEAVQVSLRRRVALKVLRFGPAADEEALQRFQREAETVAGLHHTNIVPVFFVGCENGVHYYAMQYVEGHSLADAPGSPTFRQIAHWGLQAAEALAHAHHKGVIHRDVKPSNLLLDTAGNVWLTDFGLARRADEATLTAAGAVLGTPRYMSPEQVLATQQPVDHRSDLYSLGATLYELTTGKPVFEAADAHQLFLQILDQEPPRPRTLRPQVPRDLETILLKCLAKQPQQRYATARDLAEDLRAFLDGRAIRARRPNIVERALRSWRKHRRSTVLSIVSALAATALLIGVLVARQSYVQSRLGRVTIVGTEDGLTGEILDDQGAAVLPPFPVARAGHELTLPQGPYLLRLSAPERFGDLLTLDIRRGPQEVIVGLTPPNLSHIFFPGMSPGVVELDGRADVIMAGNQGLTRLNFFGPNAPLWSVNLLWGAKSRGSPVKQAADYDPERLLHGYRKPPFLVRPAPDLDGDGTGDLVFAKHANVLAVSGRTGRVLWWYSAGFTEGTCLGAPVVADLDGTGSPGLVVTFGRFSDDGKRFLPFVEALDAGGKRLWRYDLDPLPRDTTWVPAAAQVVRLGPQPVVVCSNDRQLVRLDARTGKLLGPPLEVGFRPSRPPQFVDLDDNGVTDVLLLERKSSEQSILAVWSLGAGKQRWQRQVLAGWHEGCSWPLVADLDGDGKPEIIVSHHDPKYPSRFPGLDVLDGATGGLRWHRALWALNEQIDHVLVGPDLDGDGCRDLFVGTFGMHPFEQATADEKHLFVTALSGKDGRTLWWWHQPVRDRLDPYHLPMCLWQTHDKDGEYQLAVSLRTGDARTSATYLLSASTGTLRHVLPGSWHVGVADLDGDGTPDLYYCSHQDPVAGSHLHAIRGQPRPQPPFQPPTDSWHTGEMVGVGNLKRDFDKSPHLFDPVHHDLDGDGLTDLVGNRNGKLTALSGRDGRVLWKSNLDANHLVLTGERFDLDGDGVPDLFHCDNTDVQAISGKTGRTLWSVRQAVGAGQDVHLCYKPQKWTYMWPVLRCQDLDGDGRPEVLAVTWVYKSGRRGQAPLVEAELTLLAGNDGRVRWKRPLGTCYGDALNNRRLLVADLDGDGTLDVALLLLDETMTWRLLALSGADGSVLATRTLAPAPAWVRQLLDRPEHQDWRGPLLSSRDYWPVLSEGPRAPGKLAPVVVVDLVCAASAMDKQAIHLEKHHWQVDAFQLEQAARQWLPVWSWQGAERSPASVELRAEPAFPVRNMVGNLKHVGPALVLFLWKDYHEGGELIVLDAAGKLHERLDGQRNQAWRLYDFVGNGTHAVLSVTPEGGLRLSHRFGGPALWETRLHHGTFKLPRQRILLYEGGQGQSPVVAVRMVGSFNGVVGIDARNGKSLWQVAGENLLWSSKPGELPRALSDQGDCFAAQPWPDSVPRRRYDAVPPDPRLTWWMDPFRPCVIVYYAFSGCLAVALLAIPAALLGWWYRARSWRRGAVVVLYGALLAVALRSWVVVPANLPDAVMLPPVLEVLQYLAADNEGLWVRTLLGLPVAGFTWLVVRWTSQQHWRKLALLALTIPVASVIHTAVQAWIVYPQQMESSEHLSLRGWQWGWLVGIYDAGWVIPLFLAVVTVVRRLRRTPPAPVPAAAR